MQFLIFTKDVGDGDTQRVVATLANYWAGRRREVTIVTLAPGGEDFYMFSEAATERRNRAKDAGLAGPAGGKG